MQTQNFRDILKAELEKRQLRNPRYSLRSFARDLGLSAPRLSDVLRGRYGLSRGVAESLAEKLKLPEEEAAYFCDLVEASHGRSRHAKELALARLRDRADAGGATVELTCDLSLPPEELGRALLAKLRESGATAARVEISARLID